MSHFYGVMQGSRGEATRCGTKASGLQVTAASWGGAVQVDLYLDSMGRDCYRVTMKPWRGAGDSATLAEGVVGVAP